MFARAEGLAATCLLTKRKEMSAGTLCRKRRVACVANCRARRRCERSRTARCPVGARAARKSCRRLARLSELQALALADAGQPGRVATPTLFWPVIRELYRAGTGKRPLSAGAARALCNEWLWYDRARTAFGALGLAGSLRVLISRLLPARARPFARPKPRRTAGPIEARR